MAYCVGKIEILTLVMLDNNQTIVSRNRCKFSKNNCVIQGRIMSIFKNFSVPTSGKAMYTYMCIGCALLIGGVYLYGQKQEISYKDYSEVNRIALLNTSDDIKAHIKEIYKDKLITQKEFDQLQWKMRVFAEQREQNRVNAEMSRAKTELESSLNGGAAEALAVNSEQVDVKAAVKAVAKT